MPDITVRTKPEELESIYLEAHEMAESVEQLNSTLDTMDPLLDRLNHELDLHKIKKTRVKSKLSTIMAKL